MRGRISLSSKNRSMCWWVWNLFFGFFFYHFLLLCDEDINECSEGLDDCNSQTQLCLNTKGGFKCQEKIDKIGDKCLPGLKFDEETKLCEGW